MRKYTEPTAKNLLRQPLVLGISLVGLIVLSFIVLGLFVLGGTSDTGNILTVTVAAVGYGGLRVMAAYSKAGWEESLIFPLEKKLRKPEPALDLTFEDVPTFSPDTLEPIDLIHCKDNIQNELGDLGQNTKRVFLFKSTAAGHELKTFCPEKPGIQEVGNLLKMIEWSDPKYPVCYSLHSLPATTDPLFMFNFLRKLPTKSQIIVQLQGIRLEQVRNQINRSRSATANTGKGIPDIDSKVTFEDASQVLEGISRGEDGVLEVSLVLLTPTATDLDPNLFMKETNLELSLNSILGFRKRLHRSHVARLVTSCDLIPNICDPMEQGAAILSTARGLPLYFSPQDPRLEALHWLVIGASGSGKSFFTGLVLKRMLDEDVKMSVVFLDHNRSFRRFVKNSGSTYLEPESLRDLTNQFSSIESSLDTPGSMCGIELSDILVTEKKEAIHWILSKVENTLRTRDTFHPVYLVLDECWNFMRDEPVLVQRAFREFRKLNGAVVAITQSLSDFLSDDSGKAILQNAPIRVLLRQGEDLAPYRGALSLNSVELEKVRHLRQSKGKYSECLVKTPFLSRIGRLSPTASEHELLRTDNIREEMTSTKSAKGGSYA